MKPVDEQLALIKMGCQEIIRGEELKEKLEKSHGRREAAPGQGGV